MKEILEEHFHNIIDQNKVSNLSEYASNLSGGISDHFTLDKILSATLNGESIFKDTSIIDSLKTLFVTEIRSAMAIGVEIMVICILIGLLKNLSASFGSKSICDIATMVCTIAIIGITIVHFESVYEMALDALKTLTYTMEILLPILIGIVIGMGQITTGTIMSPLMLSMITFFQNIIKNLIFPALFISGALILLNCLTEKDYVNYMARFLRKLVLYGTGLMITILTGIITVQNVITKTSDGLILNTAKYSISSFIPIVGSFTAETLELFLKCMQSIKSIVGIFGILLICALILYPILKCLAIACIYKVTACFIEPVASKKIAEGINEIGTVLVTVSAILFFSSLLFILFITAIISLKGST